MVRWIFRIVVALFVLAGVVFGGAALLDTDTRPAPNLPVAYTNIKITTPARDKPVDVHIWYPTDVTGTQELIGQNALFYGFYALRDAKPKAGLLPIVVMSHGSGGNAVQMGWIATELARRGLIVVAPNHQGTTSRDSDPFQTVKVWERADDLKAVLDFIEKSPPFGLQPDMTRVASFGFSLGGFSALSLAGVQVSKAQFLDYCAKNAGVLDCGWMQKAGVDFTAIDATKYEQSNRDPRVSITVAVDPALPLAMTDQSLQSLTMPTLIINLGEPDTIPAGMRLDEVVKRMPGANYQFIPKAHHFTFVAECSKLGEIIIGLAGEDNICSDKGFRPRGEVHRELIKLIGDFLLEKLSKGNA